MTRPKRRTRDVPAQNAPIRNPVVGAANGSGGASTNGAPRPVSDVLSQGLDAARFVVDAATAPMRGAVERGVESAYMVIEEYMLRGRQAAARFQQRRAGSEDMSDERPYGAGSAGPWGPMGPLVGTWMQMMRMWTDSMSPFIPGGSAMATDWMNQFAPAMAGVWGAGRVRQSVVVSASCPTEVALDIDPGAEAMPLRVEPLAPMEAAGGPPLAGVGIECSAGRIQVRVTVPDDQPAGTYRGAVTDAGGNRRGELRVELRAEERRHAREEEGGRRVIAAGVAADEGLVPSLLREYGEATRALLFDYLPAQEPRRYLYDLVADYPRRGGRAFRPTLCIATARAFGSALEAAIRTAVSIELVHNAMLIHDDIEDGSEERRGLPTMHVTEGVPISINVGDMLSMLSMRPLLDNRTLLGTDLSLRILEETERMARESAEGQALELGWRRDNVMEVAEQDYLHMVLKKTCWLATIHPSRVGALIGARGTVDPDRFIRFGFFLGAAFQVQDDLLNLVGNAQRYGKELGGDIYEGKRTLMLIRLYEQSTPDERRRLTGMLAQPRESRTVTDVRWARERMDHYDCLDYARQVAHGLAGAAWQECVDLYRHLPDTRDKRFIEALPAWVIQRN